MAVSLGASQSASEDSQVVAQSSPSIAPDNSRLPGALPQEPSENSELPERLKNATFDDILNDEIGYARLPCRELDYLEMTNLSGTETAQTVCIGNVFMGLEITELEHIEVFVENEWHDVKLRARLEGIVDIEGTLHNGDMISFEINEASYGKLPVFVFHDGTKYVDTQFVITETDVAVALQEKYGDPASPQYTKSVEGIIITFRSLHKSFNIPYLNQAENGEIVEVKDSSGEIIYAAQDGH